MNNWKPVAGFIENTIRPLIEEMKWFLEELERQGIIITERNIEAVIKHIGGIYLTNAIIKLIQTVLIAIVIGYVICRIYK